MIGFTTAHGKTNEPVGSTTIRMAVPAALLIRPRRLQIVVSITAGISRIYGNKERNLRALIQLMKSSARSRMFIGPLD